MHARAEACHLSQNSKKLVFTDFLCRCIQYGLKNHWLRHLFKHRVNVDSQGQTGLHVFMLMDHISNLAISSNNYALLLSALCVYVQVKKWCTKRRRRKKDRDIVLEAYIRCTYVVCIKVQSWSNNPSGERYTVHINDIKAGDKTVHMRE